MENKEENNLNGVSFSKDIDKNNIKYEDEINMMDFFGIFYKRKYFIIFGSFLPALFIALILFLYPKDYKVTYTYDIGQNGIDYDMLLEKVYGEEECDSLITMLKNNELSEKEQTKLIESFYGAENLNKLRIKLMENGYDKYAQEISKAKIQLGFQKSLLNITIIGRHQEELKKISTIVKNNLEAHLLIYFKSKELNNDIVLLKADMAEIEKDSFNLEMELDRKKAILHRLRNINSSDSNNIPQSFVLHFDNIRGNSEFLPMEYQIQVIDANIIYIEETLFSNQKKYDYYNTLISLSENLLEKIKNNASSFNTAQEFTIFVANSVSNYTKTELNDFVTAYIQNISNIVFNNIPLEEKPAISVIQRDIVKKSIVVCAVLLMTTTLIAFLKEAVQKNKHIVT